MSRVALMTANHYGWHAVGGKAVTLVLIMSARPNYEVALRLIAMITPGRYHVYTGRPYFFQTASRIFDILIDRTPLPVYSTIFSLILLIQTLPHYLFTRLFMRRLHFSLFSDDIFFFFSLKNETNKSSQMNVFRCLFRTIHYYSLRNLPFCFVVLILDTVYTYYYGSLIWLIFMRELFSLCYGRVA